MLGLILMVITVLDDANWGEFRVLASLEIIVCVSGELNTTQLWSEVDTPSAHCSFVGTGRAIRSCGLGEQDPGLQG